MAVRVVDRKSVLRVQRITTRRQGAQRQRAIFRKSLLLPAEHGSWSWLLVPFFVGVVAAGRWNLPATLALLGGLAAFTMRQPWTVWLRVRRGRARRSDGPIALGWTLVLGLIALTSLAGLLSLGRQPLLWLLLPLAAIWVLYLLAANRPGKANTRSETGVRTLWMETAGAAGLAMTAPAAFIAATGELSRTAWLLWALMAAQNVLGMAYVRLRIANTHSRPMNRSAVLAAHLVAMAGVLILADLRQIPWMILLPFAGFLLRAVWLAIRPRPIADIKRFGFKEVGVEILGGAVIGVGYWLGG